MAQFFCMNSTTNLCACVGKGAFEGNKNRRKALTGHVSRSHFVTFVQFLFEFKPSVDTTVAEVSPQSDPCFGNKVSHSDVVKRGCSSGI